MSGLHLPHVESVASSPDVYHAACVAQTRTHMTHVSTGGAVGPLLLTPRVKQSNGPHQVTAGARNGITREGRHDGRVDCKLGSVPQGQASRRSTGAFKSRTRVLVVTRAPASRQIRAVRILITASIRKGTCSQRKKRCDRQTCMHALFLYEALLGS